MTRAGRRIHAGFILAALLAAWTYLVPMSWPRHLIVFCLGVTFLLASILGAVLAAAWDIIRPRREREYPRPSTRWDARPFNPRRWE